MPTVRPTIWKPVIIGATLGAFAGTYFVLKDHPPEWWQAADPMLLTACALGGAVAGGIPGVWWATWSPSCAETLANVASCPHQRPPGAPTLPHPPVEIRRQSLWGHTASVRLWPPSLTAGRAGGCAAFLPRRPPASPPGRKSYVFWPIAAVANKCLVA